MAIHETAIVSAKAELDDGVDVGPFAVIEDDVEVSRGVRIGSHAVLKSGLRIGERVEVHEGAVLGGTPQDLKFRGARSRAIIGADSVIREFSTVHRSTSPDADTVIGARCFLMAFGHVAHDCVIGDGVTIASYVALAGHVEIGDGAFVSGGAAIHQHTRIGELSMIGGGSKVNLDVPPFITVDGVPATAVGLNIVGLRRHGVPDDDVIALKRAYRTLFREKRARADALEIVGAMASSRARRLGDFVAASERGVCRSRVR